MTASTDRRTQVLVIGSGAGGATTAATLAEAGYDVLIAEEGLDAGPEFGETHSPRAIAQLYRGGGLTPILGNESLAFVEGCCVGGSTEVNSGFWYRIPEHCYTRWSTDALVEDLSRERIDPYFERIERELGVTVPDVASETPSSAVLRRGAEKLGWRIDPVARCQADPAASPFAPGAKQSMRRTYLPRARAAGAELLPGCRAVRILRDGAGVTGALMRVRERAGERSLRIRADAVFVCGGPLQTPALLRRSGIRRNVGDSLYLHPMIKLAALFDHDMDAAACGLPFYQITEFSPSITIGGSVFTPGFLAMLLARDGRERSEAMPQWRNMALYYAAARGMHSGSVRAVPGLDSGVLARYAISEADRRNLSIGLALTAEALFAAGARAVYPALRSIPVATSPDVLRPFLHQPLPAAEMALSAVHAFSSCPMGENPDYCATDSYGRVRGLVNLYVNDASLIPDSPGANPQGTTMALAMRNAERFAERARHGRPQRAAARAPRPDFLVTGAPGWLGTRLVETLCAAGHRVRCLVAPGADPDALGAAGGELEVQPGDLRDRESLEAFCRGAEGATLLHAAGLIHPALRVRDFTTVNVDGTHRLLAAAQRAGLRRLVAVSSNSVQGTNRGPDDAFDEQSPGSPYLGYGASKARMEELVRGAHEPGRFETVIVRAPWFYGPNQPERQTVFFTMIRRGRFPILGDGTQRRSMAHVDNLCQGLELAARVEGAAGRTYWIADARPYPLNEIVDTVEAVLIEQGIACSGRRLRLPAAVGGLAQRVDAALQRLGLYQQQIHVLGELAETIACRIDRAEQELGYAPRVSLREGMAQAVRWCLSRGLRP
ncbi:MAG: FAD-dependent oxidoreductase [Myxococcota bacterium]|nr:FAD-dependent oxidoreductase [Myxococcota bacterium]